MGEGVKEKNKGATQQRDDLLHSHKSAAVIVRHLFLAILFSAVSYQPPKLFFLQFIFSFQRRVWGARPIFLGT